MSRILPASGALAGMVILASFSIPVPGLGDPAPLPVAFQPMDANRDGTVSEAEYVAHAAAAARAEFKQLDRDGSGVLQAGELAGAAPARASQKAAGEGAGLRRAFAADPGQRSALQKRISAGPSMRQGGR